MKLLSIFLIACAFTFSATAQKYSNATPANVTKEWRGLSFSSEKSLFQNLDETDVFSKSAPLFKGDIIADDAMLTAFVMVDSSFSELDEDAEEDDNLLLEPDLSNEDERENPKYDFEVSAGGVAGPMMPLGASSNPPKNKRK